MEGKGYRLLNEPGEIQAVQYPPLLPMIVAMHQWVMGTSDYFKVGSALRLTYFVLSGLFLLATYMLARKLFSPIYALLVAVITALSFRRFLGPSNVLYADLPFAVAVMGFLLCHEASHRLVPAIVGGIFAAAALSIAHCWTRAASRLDCRKLYSTTFSGRGRRGCDHHYYYLAIVMAKHTSGWASNLLL